MFKKIVSVVLLLAACLSFAVSAEGSLQTYIYKNGNVEIQIQHTDFTEEELARVVDRLENGDPGISAQNLWCSLFGHKLKTGLASITQHHVYSTYPYCEVTYYVVEVCERCDYENSTYDHAERVGCCTD